jgi:hypothetical protein
MNGLVPSEGGAADVYEIRLRGELDDCWSEWFEGFTLTATGDGTSTLTGRAVDQAALHGLLRRIGDVGVTLISVNVISVNVISVLATGAARRVAP